MSTAWLWTPAQLQDALQINAPEALKGVRGLSIDTRTLDAGDLFVALRDVRDGHDFVEAAFAKGAAAALIDQSRVDALAGLGPLLPVADPLTAMEALGAHRRAEAQAQVMAVTGSVGKTGTKEALRVMLSAFGSTHASAASYNNHLGVPLTLARMPLDSTYGVYEIGTNHPGEIGPLSHQVKPHIALVTTVEKVHIENFPSEEAIADEKAEIYGGLCQGGVALLPHDNRHYNRLRAHAERSPAGRLLSFGMHAEADICGLDVSLFPDHSTITASVCGQRLSFDFGAPGQHLVNNALAMLGCAYALGLDLEKAARSLAQVKPPKGRGERLTLQGQGLVFTLLDESYNANPASMRAALALLAQTPVSGQGRRIAVLGDMLELGADAERLHQDLAPSLDAHKIDCVFAAGPLMRGLYEALPASRKGAWQARAEDLIEPLCAALKTGDVVMVKGSFSSRMGEVVKALKARYFEGASLRPQSS